MKCVKITILLMLAASHIPTCTALGDNRGDTVWIGDRWFLTNPNAGRVVNEMPYDPVAVDTTILNGFAWNEERRITFFEHKSYGPSLAVSQNKVHVAHSNLIPQITEMFYQGSDDLGVGWRDSIQLSEPGGIHFSGNPDIQSIGDTLYVAWDEAGPNMYSRDVRLRKSYDGGMIWSDPIIVQEDIWSDYYPYWIRLAPIRDTVFCTYSRNYADGYWQRFKMSTDCGDNWSSERIVGRIAAGSSASIAYSGGLLSVVLGPADLEVSYYYSTDNGTSWSDEVRLSDVDGFASQWPKMACDNIGGIYATWFDYNGSPYPTTGYVLLARSIDGGESWEPIVSLSTLPTGHESSVYADSTGVYVLWRDERDGSPDTDIYFRMSRDMGATWSPEVRLDNAPNPSNRPSIRVEGGLAHVLWRDQRDMEWALYYKLGGYYVAGDADHTEEVDIDDAVYLIGYIFSSGDPPVIYRSGDSNCSGQIDIDDVVHLILFIFSGGPPPC